MRILNVTESYAPFLEFGGPPVKVRALALGLAGRGHAVTVLTADWGFEKRLRGSEAERAERTAYGWRQVEKGVTAQYLPTRLRFRASTWNPAVKKFCREKLGEFDVAHIFGLYDFLGPTVARECARRSIPYVLEPIGMYVPIVRSVWLKRTYHALYGKKMFQQAGAVIATSEQEGEELATGGIAREKIRLRRNGVETPAKWPERGQFRRALGISEEAKLILFLGRLSEKKSPDLLLRAFALLRKENVHEDLRLVYAGPDEGGMLAKLAREAKEQGLGEQVQFAGAIFGEKKWPAYRDADVFALPSQNENFGNTAAESVASGTPVVVTEQCGIAPLLADVAGLVVAHNAAALAGALRRVLIEAELRARLVKGCGKVAASLGWEGPVREMETLYTELVNTRMGSIES